MDRQKDIATQSIDDIRETISKEVDAQECLGAETEPASGLGSEGVLSKRQQKKLLKRQHVEERREQVRTVKKAARAENKSAAAAAVGPGGAPPPPVPSEEQLAKKALRRERRLDAKREFLDKAAFHVVLDCCFDHLMESPEICSMAHQLNEVYAVSRRMADREPFHLHITDMTEGGGGSKTRKELEYQRPNLQDWTATLHPDGLEQVLARVASAQEASGKGRGKVIYLTADTENKLEARPRGVSMGAIGFRAQCHGDSDMRTTSCCGYIIFSFMTMHLPPTRCVYDPVQLDASSLRRHSLHHPLHRRRSSETRRTLSEGSSTETATRASALSERKSWASRQRVYRSKSTCALSPPSCSQPTTWLTCWHPGSRWDLGRRQFEPSSQGAKSRSS